MNFEKSLCDISGLTVLRNEELSSHCGYGVGGKADFFALPTDVEQLKAVVELCETYGVNYKTLGNGTNVLFSDSGYRGVIVSLKNLDDVYFEGDNVVSLCGTNLEKLISFAIIHDLSGLEKLSGIPATVGGAVVMNAGAFGVSVSDCLCCAEVLRNGKIIRLNKDECGFGYRKSNFQKSGAIIISAAFKLQKGERFHINSDYKLCSVLRKNIQPQGRCCGSVFKNSEKVAAGKIIEMCGLKGYGYGGAYVSDKHANFIMTKHGAKAGDVYYLIKYVKEKVYHDFGVLLSEEIEYVGDF